MHFAATALATQHRPQRRFHPKTRRAHHRRRGQSLDHSRTMQFGPQIDAQPRAIREAPSDQPGVLPL